MEQAIHGNLKGFDVNFLFVSLFSDMYFRLIWLALDLYKF